MMNNRTEITKWQSGLLVALRFLIGWHLLYEGIFKVLKPEWSSVAFLAESKWILSGIADWITSNQGVLNTVDFMNTWGLIAIGLGLILGIFTRTAAIAGTVLLGLYYLFNPPLVGLGTMAPLEGNYLIVNKNLIEAVMLALIATSPAARSYGLDALFVDRKGDS
jgi:thiosulfate dehydrogenase [quinone] large subunit